MTMLNRLIKGRAPAGLQTGVLQLDLAQTKKPVRLPEGPNSVGVTPSLYIAKMKRDKQRSGIKMGASANLRAGLVANENNVRLLP